jgi:hypothetical protein
MLDSVLRKSPRRVKGEHTIYTFSVSPMISAPSLGNAVQGFTYVASSEPLRPDELKRFDQPRHAYLSGV